MQDFLSQDEVDALLKGVCPGAYDRGRLSEDGTLAKPPAGTRPGGVRLVVSSPAGAWLAAADPASFARWLRAVEQVLPGLDCAGTAAALFPSLAAAARTAGSGWRAQCKAAAENGSASIVCFLESGNDAGRPEARRAMAEWGRRLWPEARVQGLEFPHGDLSEGRWAQALSSLAARTLIDGASRPARPGRSGTDRAL